MSAARRRRRPAPLRWSGAVAIAGACILCVGAYLQYGDDRAGASSPTPATASPTPSTSSPTTCLAVNPITEQDYQRLVDEARASIRSRR